MENVATTIRPPGSAEDQASLQVSTTSQYAWIYNDQGSGASMDVSIFRPQAEPGWFILGDYAQGNYSDPFGTSLLVQVSNDDPANPLLMPPVSYAQVWNDSGSGGSNDGSVWYPVPPDGYVSIGFVGQNGYDQPNIPNYMCVRQDMVAPTSAAGLIWNDQGSGAGMDVSLYQIDGIPGLFVAQGDYNPFSGSAFQLIGFNSRN